MMPEGKFPTAQTRGDMDEVVVSFDSLPKIGGAHLWLYEVYRRWPTGVRLLAASMATSDEERTSEAVFDRLPHGSLEMHRSADAIHSIGIADVDCWVAMLRNARRIRQLASRPRVRVSALRAVPEGFCGYLSKKMSIGTRLVTYAHGEDVLIARTSRLMTLMAKAVYDASDLVIANSENTRRLVLALSPSARVAVVHPGVDIDAFDGNLSGVEEERSAWGWPPGTLVLATVSRMEERKNQSAVIRAVSELRAEGLDVAYVCAGAGPEAAQLRQLASALGLESHVRFPGRVSDAEKCRIFGAADIHVMPSIDVGEMIEGFGIVFLEAAAAGTPSIAGRSGGQSEAVLDGQTGYLVDGRSLADLKQAVRALADAGLRQRMGANARAWAVKHAWPDVVRQICELLRGVV